MSKGRRVNKALRGGGWTFIALGLAILEFAAYEILGTAIIAHGHQTVLRKEFNHAIDSPVVSGSPVPGITDPNSPRAIALLKIPKKGIELDVIVVDGVTLGDLAYGPGRYPTTAKIGEKGSMAIAGHRTGWGSPFLNLDKIRPGDTITIEATTGTTYSYSVTKSVIVSPSEVSVLRGNPSSSADTQLTLTTCTPKYTSRNRLIVWADLVSTKAKT